MNVFQLTCDNTIMLHWVPDTFATRHGELNGTCVSIPDWVTERTPQMTHNLELMIPCSISQVTNKHAIMHVCLHVRRPAECPKRKTISNLKMAISIRRLMHSPRGTQNFTAHQSPFSIGRLLKLFSCSMTRHPETRRLLNFLQTTKNKTQKIWKKRMH